MLFIYLFIIFSSFTGFNAKLNSLSDESFQKAALDVISLHRRSVDLNEEDQLHASESSPRNSKMKCKDQKRSAFASNDVPHLVKSAHFMHSYIPFTGVGNREEVFIDNIHEERLMVKVPSRIAGWKYLRFNSTDFVMAYQEHRFSVWRMQLTRDVKQFTFDHKMSFCELDLSGEETIIETIFYTKLIKHVEVLFVATTIQTSRGYELRAFEVTLGECVPTLIVPLKNNRPSNIGFVSSQYDSAIVLLYASGDRNTKIVHKKNLHEEHIKVIEVFARNPKDLETFTINGFGYIAVATSDGCDIFRLSEFINEQILFDRIAKHGIVDIKAFRLGFDHFLGIATRGNTQFLYIWHGGSFYPKQNFTVDSVLQWNTIDIPTCRDDVLLLLYRFDMKSPVLIYLWNGQTREFELAVANIRQMMPYGYSVSPFSQAAFSYDHTAYVLEVDLTGVSHLISITTRLGHVDDPVILRGMHITEMMNQLKGRFDFHQEFINKVLHSIKHAVLPNSPNTFAHPQVFQTLQVLNGVIGKNIQKLGNVIWKNSPLSMHDLRFKISDLKGETNRLVEILNGLKSKLPDVVLRSVPTLITGHKTILGPVRLSSLNASSIQVNTIGGHAVRQLLDKTYRLGQTRRIRGNKVIVNPALVKGSISAGLVNGIDLNKQVVITHKPQLITGPIKFNTPLTITHDLIIQGKLNGLDLKTDIVYLNKSSVIRAPKVFTSPVTIANGVVAGTIDGVDLTRLIRTALFSSGKQEIKGRKIMVGQLTTKCINVDGLVNGIDINNMANGLVYIDEAAQIKGRKTFLMNDVFIKNNLVVNGRVNGKKIPDDFLLSNGRQTISSPKHFTGLNIFEEQVNVRGLTDGLRLSDDVVTLTRNETIMGPVIIKDGINGKNIIARQLVDGVDISDLNLRALKIYDNQIHGNVRFRHPIKAGRLEINNTINGINLNRIFLDAIFKGTPSVTITGNKRFMGHVQMQQMFAHKINGFNVSDFVTTYKNETINGNIMMHAHSSFQSAIVSGHVDNIHLDGLLNNRISLSANEDILGMKTFADGMSAAQGLRVNGTLGGIVPHLDLVLKSKPDQVISGHKNFTKSIVANNLKIHSPVMVNGKVDNVNLKNIDDRRVKLNHSQIFLSQVTFINCNASHIDLFGKINDMNITQFASNVMSTSKPQNVFAPKWFLGSQYNTVMNTSRGVNGINLRQVNGRAFHLNGHNEVSAPFVFTHNLHIERPLIVAGLINGINLTGFASDAVYKSGHALISGHNSFRSGFLAEADINTRYVNRINLSRHILTTTRNHIMSGKVTFTNTLNVINNISVSGLVNAIDLSEFDRRVMKTNQLNRVIGNIEFNGPHTFISNLTASGLINGINLTSLFNDALFRQGNQEIYGDKVFRSEVQFLSKVDAQLINGLTTHSLLNDIVFAHSPHEQIIYSPKTFKSDLLAFNGLQQINGANNIAVINGINLISLERESIRTNVPTSLNGVRFFKNNTIIIGNHTQLIGRVNGIDLMRDVIFTRPDIGNSAPQVIFGKKTFSNLILMDDVTVKGLVNGFPLQSFAINTLYTSGNQLIEGKKIIGGLMMSRGNNLVNSLNGMKVPESFVTLSGNQTIYGPLIMNNTMNGHNIRVDGLISGINLARFMNESMFKNVQHTLKMPLRMDAAVFQNDVQVAGHVDHVDLSALLHDAREFTSVVNISKELMVHTLNRHEYIIEYLYRILEKSKFEINRFVLHQQLNDVSGEHIEVEGDGKIAISSHYGNDVTTFSLRYNTESELFESQVSLGFTPFIDRKFFHIGGQAFEIYCSAKRNLSSQLYSGSHLLGSLGYLISDIEVLVIDKEHSAFVFAVNDLQGVINVYHVSKNNHNATIFTNLGAFQVAKGITKIKPFIMKNEIYIAIGRVISSSCMVDDAGSLLFIWENRKRFKLLQRFTISASHVVHYQDERKHYLAFNEINPYHVSPQHQSIHIYRTGDFNDCYFTLFQRLHVDSNVRQLSAFKFGALKYPQQYFFVVSESLITIWKQEGESGFKTHWSLPIGDAKSVKFALVGEQLFVFVARNNECHHSVVFRAKMKGVSLTPIILINN